jgi:hypothetical protein
MQPKSFIAFAGFVLLIAASYCPLLRPFGLMSWNVYDLNKPYGITILLIAIVGIAGVVLKRPAIMRIAAWISLILVVLLYVAAVLKVNTTFSFIPFKGFAGFLARQIKFKWGWYPLFAAPVLALVGAIGNKAALQKNNQL